MSALVERKQDQVPAPVASQETSAIISMIERASRDPAVDVDKFERLMAMRERIEAKESEKAFNVAMNAAQGEMRPVAADANNPQTRSKYASFAALDKSLRPIYARHGFSLSFDEADSPKADHVRVLCYVAHSGGHTRTYHKDMPADGKGAKGGDVMTKTHATGAAASYGARYLLKGIFNVAIGEDDADGNDPIDASPVSDEQADQIRELIGSTKTDVGKFLAYFQIESIADLPAGQFSRAMSKLEATKRMRG